MGGEGGDCRLVCTDVYTHAVISHICHVYVRFITILYYLNDVDEGGETAFPIADQESSDDVSCVR